MTHFHGLVRYQQSAKGYITPYIGLISFDLVLQSIPEKTLVISLILPIFDYCKFVYCNMNNECIARLPVAMNNAIRYIFNVGRREHITSHYVKIGWLKILERRDLQIRIET
jgi:hypothetical protein